VTGTIFTDITEKEYWSLNYQYLIEESIEGGRLGTLLAKDFEIGTISPRLTSEHPSIPH
jgi:hypothetical protein